MAWLAGNKDPDGGSHAQTADKANPVAAAAGIPYTSGGAREVYIVTGAPTNTLGNNGDYAFRIDGTAGATRFYQKAAGSWSAVAAVN